MGESVTIKVNLDITKSKREIEEQKKATNQSEAAIDRVKAKIRSVSSTQRDSAEWHRFQAALDPEGRKMDLERISNRFRLIQQQQVSQPKDEQVVPGLRDLKEKFSLKPDPVTESLSAAMKDAAKLYGYFKLTAAAGNAALEGLKGITGLSDDNPAMQGVQTFVEGVLKSMDDFEARVMAFMTSALSTYELGRAGANISGGKAIEYSIYANQEYDIDVANKDLERAFSRFQNRQFAKSFGDLFSEASKRASQ